MKYSSSKNSIPTSTKAEYVKGIFMRHMLHAPVPAFLDVLCEFNETYIMLGFENHATIQGRLHYRAEKYVCSVEDFRVRESLRTQGIGKRLLQGLVIVAKDEGAEELWSDSVSNMALGVRLKLLGEDSLRFYDSDSPKPDFLPITINQATARNVYIDQHNENNPNSPLPHTGVWVDLSSLNTSDWNVTVAKEYDEGAMNSIAPATDLSSAVPIS